MNRDRERLLQIAERAERITRHAARGRDVFLADEVLQGFILYWIAGVGESVKGLPAELRARHPEVDWKPIAGMRDVISHKYDGMDLDVAWIAAERRVPALKAAVERILATDPAVRG